MNNFFISPLEQFEISALQPVYFYGFDLTVTNSTAYIALTVLVIVLFYIFSLHKTALVPNVWQSVVEIIYIFVLNMVKQQVGSKGIKYFPFFFLIFNFILISNLLGLLPLGFTTTGQIVITFTVAFSINLGLIFIGFFNYGLKFLNLFVPSDAPNGLVPLIVVIEVVSYLLRTFSLAIRLFANMMAGHTLLFILSSFVIAFLNNSHTLLAFFPFILILAVMCLELGIAFLQAYVFTILSTIYINDSLNLH